MTLPSESLSPLIHLSLFAMLHRPDRHHALLRKSERHLALFCHLSRTLNQLASRIPWHALSKADQSAASAALSVLEDALNTAKAAAFRE